MCVSENKAELEQQAVPVAVVGWTGHGARDLLTERQTKRTERRQLERVLYSREREIGGAKIALKRFTTAVYYPMSLEQWWHGASG